MRLRTYQARAVEAIAESLDQMDSTLVVLPTGCGKTVVFGSVVHEMDHARALVIAHREELIWQAADKIKAITGEEPAIEMAEYRASANMFGQARVVVASVQTLNAGAGDGRMASFDFAKFGLIVIDEAHHATATTYRNVLTFARQQNPHIKVLGVTATPDRADEQALGQIFESVAYTYDIIDAINDGYLVPILSRSVMVDGLDLSTVKTTAGDLNGADLAKVMEYESNLHEIAHPLYELAGHRKTLVFAASVGHAERLAEILNRHQMNCAQWICGETPKEQRRQMFADFAAKRFQFLVNVGVATEGFDDPGIEVVAMARPTKSRSLFAQMAGRGTRVLPGIIDRPNAGTDLFSGSDLTAVERRAAIAASAKPHVEILDFVGNAGKHKLVTAADILGGNHSDAALNRAKEKAKADGTPKDVLEALKEAEEEIQKEREHARQAEASRRAALRLKTNYSTQAINPFDVFDLNPWRERGWDTGRQPSQNQLALLERQGIKTDGLTFTQVKQLLGEITSRWDKGLCSYKQAKLLQSYGIDASKMTRQEASAAIDRVAANGWKRPQKTAEDYAVAGITRY